MTFKYNFVTVCGLASVSLCAPLPHLPFNTHIHAHTGGAHTHAHTLTQSYTLIYSERVLIIFLLICYITQTAFSLSLSMLKKGVFTPPYLSYITALKIPHMRVMIVFYHCVVTIQHALLLSPPQREPGLPRAPCLSQIDMGEWAFSTRVPAQRAC